MQSVDSYLSEIIAAITPVPARELPIAEADGSVLAADATAAWPLPGFDNSSMDGYAVLAADVATASADSPVTLPVDGEVAAGETSPATVTPGRCVRIMTGAIMPPGADAVVPVEWTDGGTRSVAIRQAPAKGNAIRRAGDDAQPGDLLLPAGTPIGPAQVGVLAAAGHGTISARPRPRVTVIATGNELAPPGSPLVPGLIWDSNSFMLTAAARRLGCAATRHPTVPDEPQAVLAALAAAADSSDLLITSGGVSMGGEHDVVKAALESLGSVKFRKVAMQPGMPQGFGLIGERQTPILTLPGNPVSAFVSFTIFAGPAARALQGIYSQRAPLRQATLTGPVHSPPGRRSFLRGIAEGEAAVVPLTGQGSHQIAALAKANLLIIVPEDATSLPAGALVDILDLP